MILIMKKKVLLCLNYLLRCVLWCYNIINGCILLLSKESKEKEKKINEKVWMFFYRVFFLKRIFNGFNIMVVI